MDPIYNSIGKGYTATRAADPRIVGRLMEHIKLPLGSSILDIGAGTGNYSAALVEAGYDVTALEPSDVMRRQGKRHPRLKWIEGRAEQLPYGEAIFDGIVMTLCMHHFSDWHQALQEADRVAGNGPIVILTFDPNPDNNFWLFDYFPSFLQKDIEWFPALSDIAEYSSSRLNRLSVASPFALPADLVDHFAAAGWARPEIYLDASYQNGISSFSSVQPEEIQAGLKRLESDLNCGRWDEQHGHLREQDRLQVGYVFLTLDSDLKTPQ